MRKIISILLSGVIMLSLAACTTPTNSEKSEQTIKISTRNGEKNSVEVEFPTNPQRIAVLDMAALDILDNIGQADKIVGVAKSSSIDYLQSYINNDSLKNLGTVKEADLEALMECDPDVIFIGARMAGMYDELVKIAPVYMVYTDTQIGVVQSTSVNAKNIASMFGEQEKVENLMSQYASRIDAIKTAAANKNAIIGMVNAGGFSLLGNDGRCSIIGSELGFNNVGVDANIDTSAHGNEASFEYVLDKNPDYIFAMDRDAAIGTQGAKLAADVLNNELVNKTTAAQNGNVVVLEHSSVWYTAEGGITALDTMLLDIEKNILK